MQSIYSAHEENFSLVLPIFVYTDKEAALSSYSDLNRTIEKAGKCVRKHSITVKPKKKSGKLTDKQKAFQNKHEYVKWIDDAELLEAKSNMIKQDYFAAIEQFSHIIRQYDDQDTKTEAYIWLARCYTEMGKYDQANDFLNTLTSDMTKVSKKLRGDLAATQADLLLRQSRYVDALPFVEEAISFTKAKRDKVRLMYIAAQLSQLNEENRRASDWYQKVIDCNPDYKYVFNASINKAAIFNSETGNSEQMQRTLSKMLKDEKNVDYLDQIYYALGSIAYNEMHDDDALWFFKQSVANSTSNENQKSISYLSIADIYFELPNYKQAQLYYDSALVSLPREYPNYADIKNKADNLTALVNCTETIQREDSLQRLAKMSEKERNRVIDKLIQKVVAEEQAERAREAEAQNDLVQAQQLSRQNTQSGGAWYFYNPASLSLGQNEFKKKWGNRKLEDNWRRSNKSSTDWDSMNEPDTVVAETNAKSSDKKSREYYLADIPLTDSAFKVSQHRLQTAYYDLGVVYKDKFADYQLATNAFIDYLNRYKKSDLEVDALFNLYRVYLLQKDYANADIYKKRVVNEYPNTDYAKILTDPDYYKELEKAENQLNFMYQATYQFFLNDECESVASTFAYVDSAYSNSKLIPKFELLYTLCSGKNCDTATFEAKLKDFVAKYPKTDESGFASEVIAALNRKPHQFEELTPEQLLAEQQLAEQRAYDSLDISLYNYNADEQHYYLVVVDNSKLDENKVKFNLIDFNDAYFDFLNFDVNSVRLAAETSLVLVSNFKNAKMARNYIESVIIAGEAFESITTDSYQHFTISKSNYDKLLEDRNVDRYKKFFELNYTVKP